MNTKARSRIPTRMAGYFTAVLRASDLRNRLFVAKMAEGDLVPELLEPTGDQTGATYSHLYITP
jgi:hypothetical protein